MYRKESKQVSDGWEALCVGGRRQDPGREEKIKDAEGRKGQRGEETGIRERKRDGGRKGRKKRRKRKQRRKKGKKKGKEGRKEDREGGNKQGSKGEGRQDGLQTYVHSCAFKKYL